MASSKMAAVPPQQTHSHLAKTPTGLERLLCNNSGVASVRSCSMIWRGWAARPAERDSLHLHICGPVPTCAQARRRRCGSTGLPITMHRPRQSHAGARARTCFNCSKPPARASTACNQSSVTTRETQRQGANAQRCCKNASDQRGTHRPDPHPLAASRKTMLRGRHNVVEHLQGWMLRGARGALPGNAVPSLCQGVRTMDGGKARVGKGGQLQHTNMCSRRNVWGALGSSISRHCGQRAPREAHNLVHPVGLQPGLYRGKHRRERRAPRHLDATASVLRKPIGARPKRHKREASARALVGRAKPPQQDRNGGGTTKCRSCRQSQWGIQSRMGAAPVCEAIGTSLNEATPP